MNKKTPVEEVRLDTQRSARTGFSEIIYCPGKSDEQLANIARSLKDSHENILFSRVTEAQHGIIASALPDAVAARRRKPYIPCEVGIPATFQARLSTLDRESPGGSIPETRLTVAPAVTARETVIGTPTVPLTMSLGACNRTRLS